MDDTLDPAHGVFLGAFDEDESLRGLAFVGNTGTLVISVDDPGVAKAIVDALLEIAQQALSKKTGVRAVRSIVEALLLEVQYSLPSSKERSKFIITADFVRGEGSILRERLPKVQKRESA